MAYERTLRSYLQKYNPQAIVVEACTISSAAGIGGVLIIRIPLQAGIISLLETPVL